MPSIYIFSFVFILLGSKVISFFSTRLFTSLAVKLSMDLLASSTNFFEDVQIELSNNILNIKLIEHPVINQLIILGEDRNKFLEQIKKLIKSREKDSYIKNNIVKDVDIIKQLYGSLGYNFVQVETKVKKIGLNVVFFSYQSF